MLRYADDIVLLAKKEEEVGSILNGMNKLVREKFVLRWINTRLK